MSRRTLAVAIGVVLAAAWALVPAVRAVVLVQHGATTMKDVDAVAHEEVVFLASDGVRLAGTYSPVAGAHAAVVLVHGFKNDRADMVEHARFLNAAGYSTLLYDSRGCGASGGTFGVGATEDRDIIGAVSYLKTRGTARVAVLGVSLGAGDALLAAARDPRIDAVVADSSWADERVQLQRMATVTVGPLAVPLLPYEPVLVDLLVGGRLEDARPRDEVGRIAPRPILLIHSADDENATTTPADARAIFAAAGEPREMWVAPRGGHAGAFAAFRDEYIRRVTDFLARVFR